MKWKIPEGKQKLYLVCFAAMALLIIAYFLLFSDKDRLVSVLEFSGTTGILRNAGTDQEREVPVFKDMHLEVKDVVWTGEDSSVTMLVDEDKVVRLAEESRAAFAEISGGEGEQLTVIDLQNGTLVNDLRKKLNDNITYEVTTPNATISVRGTYFVVYVGEEEGYEGLVTKVNVYDGTVAVEGKNGKITILHGSKEGTEWVQFENGVYLPSGNRAVVGTKNLYTYKGVDFSGLNMNDLDRLEEMAKDHGIGVTLEEIGIQKKKLADGEPEQKKAGEDVIEKSVQDKNEEVQESSAAEPNETKKDGKADKPKENTEQGSTDHGRIPGEENKAETDNTAGDMTDPGTSVPPDSSAAPGDSSSSGNGSSGSGSSGGSSGDSDSGASKPGTVLDTEKAAYAPALIRVTNEAALQAEIDELKGKKDKLSVMSSSVAGASDKISAAQTAIDAAQLKLNEAKTKVDTVNAVLSLINALRYPCQIDESDRASVVAARSAYEGLDPDGMAMVPQRLAAKLDACQARLP